MKKYENVHVQKIPLMTKSRGELVTKAKGQGEQRR